VVTIEDVQAGALPPGTEVMAGQASLHRAVGWCVVLRARPPGLDPPRGEELILLSRRALSALDPSLSLSQFLSQVARGAAAVAVQGHVDDAALTRADALQLPLLCLPSDVSLSSVHDDVLHFLSEKRGEWYRHQHSILQDLTALALQGRGLQALAQHMSELTGNAVAFVDEAGEVLASVAASGVPTTALDAPAETDEIQRIEREIAVEGRIVGLAVMSGPAQHLDDRARSVLESGATAGAIEMARERAVLETVDRIQGGLVDDLLEGGDAEAVARRVRRAGYAVDGPHVAMAFSPAWSLPPSQVRETIARLRKRLPLVLSLHQVRALSHTDATALSIFYPLTAEVDVPELKKLAERVRYALGQAVADQPVHAGLSLGHSGVEEFRTSFQQARQALSVGQALSRGDGVTYFGDLGVYRLLFSMAGSPELEDFYQDFLGRLVRYDEERRSELVPTLEAYLHAGNAVEAAARLSVHRNSLAYRLRRIREITGLDLDNPEVRLALHLALRVGDMRGAGRHGTTGD
jgi:purine catabolism regulator